MMSEAFINLAVVLYKLFLFLSLSRSATLRKASDISDKLAGDQEISYIGAYRCKDLIDMMFHGDD